MAKKIPLEAPAMRLRGGENIRPITVATPSAEDPTTPPEVSCEVVAAFTPTAEQQAAIDGVLAFASGADGNFACIRGAAGTGKSTISRLIRQALTDAGFTVGLAAPTHKACQVLADACGVNKDATATFASLLALREKKVRDKVTFVRDYSRKPRIDEAQVWLCDEASMLEPELLEMIREEVDLWARFLFIGDVAQLFPVNFGKVSPALQLTPSFELTQVMRHDGALLDAVTAIRQTTGNAWRIPFYRDQIGDGSAIHTYPDKREWQRAILQMATHHHDGDPDAFRVLCFRRAEVAKLNAAIRRHIYGQAADPFVPGERLVTLEAVKNPDLPNGSPLYGSSRELVIQSAHRLTGKPFIAWRLIVLASGDGEVAHQITVVDPTDEAKLAAALGQLRQKALANKGEQNSWSPFWTLRDAFAQVQSHWALTVHKAQGSQFLNVFVDGPDLDSAPGDRSIRRHLWYTALTRGQQAAHLIADQEVQS